MEPAQLRIHGSISGMTNAVGKYTKHRTVEGGGKKKRKLKRAWRGKIQANEPAGFTETPVDICRAVMLESLKQN